METWDATEAAQKALSCVYRTEQRFGVAYVIDVLTGKDNERIRRFGHHRLSTHGVGADLDAREWRSVFRQLVVRGLLSVDYDGYGSLRLTEASRPVLRGETSLHMRREARPPRRERRRGGTRPAPPTGSASWDHGLWDALRQRRRELAQSQGVPPYVIFHDAALREMVEHRPRTLEDFARISGVGETKLHRYGNDFIDVIHRHARPSPSVEEGGPG